MVNPDLLIPNPLLLIFIPSPLSSLTRRKVVTVSMECIRGLRGKERNGEAQSLRLDAWLATLEDIGLCCSPGISAPQFQTNIGV